MGKFLNSIFCCIYPAEIRKSRSRESTKDRQNETAQSIITQVTPDSYNHNYTSTSRSQLPSQQQSPSRPNSVTTGGTMNGRSWTATIGIRSLSSSASSGDAGKENAGPSPGIRPPGPLNNPALLPPQLPIDARRKCLVVDLDETLVHSSFKPVENADFTIPVEIDNVVHQVYVLKRPHTDEFLERIGRLFECVLFTASLAKYADPVADLLDKRKVFRARLFRESCVYYEGNYIKDLGKLGRPVGQTIIIDNSPASYAFHPQNALPIQTWFDDPDDDQLLGLIPHLERLAQSDNIYSTLSQIKRGISGASPTRSFDDSSSHSLSMAAPASYSTSQAQEYLFSPNIGAGADVVKSSM